nr:hypothetical protein [Tanacetum cinerariifolium]
MDYPSPPWPAPLRDAKPDSEEEIQVVMNVIDELECIDVKVEFDDDGYYSFMFLIYSKFWSTATLIEPELGPPTILATIDRTPYIITEDLVRSSLQLADDGGVTDLPILEIYFGMDALGYVTE